MSNDDNTEVQIKIANALDEVLRVKLKLDEIVGDLGESGKVYATNAILLQDPKIYNNAAILVMASTYCASASRNCMDALKAISDSADVRGLKE